MKGHQCIRESVANEISALNRFGSKPDGSCFDVLKFQYLN
jgi:hypothetical protein